GDEGGCYRELAAPRHALEIAQALELARDAVCRRRLEAELGREGRKRRVGPPCHGTQHLEQLAGGRRYGTRARAGHGPYSAAAECLPMASELDWRKSTSLGKP